jgi:hypothetical protein
MLSTVILSSFGQRLSAPRKARSKRTVTQQV